jgi:hypothetical protein
MVSWFFTLLHFIDWDIGYGRGIGFLAIQLISTQFHSLPFNSSTLISASSSSCLVKCSREMLTVYTV